MLRAFSLIMAVIMVFSMVAVSVSAEELQKNQEEVNGQCFYHYGIDVFYSDVFGSPVAYYISNN